MIKNLKLNYTKEEGTKESKIFLIYCEGIKREIDYFNFFEGKSSRIKLCPISVSSGEDHSPVGLYNKAVKEIIVTADNPNPQYNDIKEDDEIWFVFDTDRWGRKVDEVKILCSNHKNWFTSQSNPSFEIWLFYHFKEHIDIPEDKRLLKTKLHEITRSGFHSKKHPNLINNAIKNSKNKYNLENNICNYGCTEVFLLAEKFYPLIKELIEENN